MTIFKVFKGILMIVLFLLFALMIPKKWLFWIQCTLFGNRLIIYIN